MNVLVTGATGYIGSWVTRKLINAGHSVTCCVRDTAYAQKLFPEAKIISCDFINDINADVWKPKLKNIDVLINCVGIFYHPNKEIIWKIHYSTPRELFHAAAEEKVKKIIHISALNVENMAVDYATSKRKLEEYLLGLSVPAVILKPSLIYGPGSYGGMSLLRGLVGFPFILPMPGKGLQKVQPLHVDDLAKAILHFVQEDSSTTETYMAVPSQPTTIANVLLTLQQWLGFSNKIILPVPIIVIKMISFIGNLIPYSTINSSSVKMLLQNNITNQQEAERFTQAIQFKPREFVEGIYVYPSNVQDRWHAHLFFIKPLLRYSLAFMWLMSAITSAFLYPLSSSYSLLSQVGINEFQPVILYGASFINFLISLSLLFNYKINLNCLLQIIVIVTYTMIISWKLPHLWLEPFGPIVKNIPILIAILVLWAVEEDR